MKPSLRIISLAALAWLLLVLLPYRTPLADAGYEMVLNSSNVQVVHNAPANSDVLNLSLNVTNIGEGGGACDGDGESDDLLETGVHVAVYQGTCVGFLTICAIGPFSCPTRPFDFFVNPYVEHDIGSFSYGTFFGSNPPGTVASKIVALATPPNTCGTWSINLQATGLNLSSIAGPKIALFVNEADASSGIGDASNNCFDVNATVGNGIVKPRRGVHRARR
jgi:hypothetical protein